MVSGVTLIQSTVDSYSLLANSEERGVVGGWQIRLSTYSIIVANLFNNIP